MVVQTAQVWLSGEMATASHFTACCTPPSHKQTKLNLGCRWCPASSRGEMWTLPPLLTREAIKVGAHKTNEGLHLHLQGHEMSAVVRFPLHWHAGW